MTQGEAGGSNRWWVDVSDQRPAIRKADGRTLRRFFHTVEGYDQETARANLTDTNRRLLESVELRPGRWVHLRLLDSGYSRRGRERIYRMLPLPPYARGVFVDSGLYCRLLVTGDPPGQRILELALTESPSFDAWVDDEWVEEQVYPGARSAIRDFRRKIRAYLSPEGIALWEELRPRA